MNIPPPVTSSVFPVPPPRPELVCLRRAAATDAFLCAAFAPPPRLLWHFIDQDNDVGASIERFFDALGYPLERLSVARANCVLGAILRTEAAQPDAGEILTLSSSARAIDRRRALGDAVRRHVSRPAFLQPWPDEGIPRALSNVRNVIDREASPDSVALRKLAAQLDGALSLLDSVRQRLLDCWQVDWRDEPYGERLTALLHTAEVAESRLEDAVTLDRAGLRNELGAILRVSADLEWLASATAAPANEVAGALEIALVTAETTAHPDVESRVLESDLEDATLDEARAHWCALRWEHHPEMPQLDAQERKRRYWTVARIDRTWSALTGQRGIRGRLGC